MLMTLGALLFALDAALDPSSVDKQAQQSVEEYVKEATVQVGFVIAKSTANYSEALASAKIAASTLGLPLKLRDLVPNKKTGLTYPRADCEREVGEYPCYFARGRFDSGAYVSIEHSTAYPDFKPNLFIVILASGAKNEPMLRTTLEKARKKFSDAYVRTAGVYTGCVH
jgi:hypothetical protein